MAVSFKSVVLRDQLAAALLVRCSLGQVKAFDAALVHPGAPILRLGTLGVPATTEQCCTIRVISVPAVAPATDILGLAQDVWTPHIVQMSYEVSAAQANASYLTTANWTIIVGEMLKLGCRVEIWERTNGTAPLEANMDSPYTNSTLKLVFDPDMYQPLMGQ